MELISRNSILESEYFCWFEVHILYKYLCTKNVEYIIEVTFPWYGPRSMSFIGSRKWGTGTDPLSWMCMATVLLVLAEPGEFGWPWTPPRFFRNPFLFVIFFFFHIFVGSPGNFFYIMAAPKKVSWFGPWKVRAAITTFHSGVWVH